MRGSLGAFCIVTIALSCLYYLVLWFVPLYALDSLETSYQDTRYSDQNFYLYYANYYRQFPPNDLTDYNVTWSSMGVVLYLTSVCRLTGSVYSHLFTNLFILFVILYFAKRRLELVCNHRISLNILSSLAFPVTFLLIGMPGKEIFSCVALLCITMSLVCFEQAKWNSLCWLGSAVILSGFSRPHEAVIIMGIYCFYIAYRSLGIWSILGLLLFAPLVFEFIITTIINPLMGINFASLSDQVVSTDEGLSSALVSENLFFHVALAPIRMAYLYLGVIYKSMLLFSFDFHWYFLFRDVPLGMRAIDFLSGLVVVFTMIRRRTMFLPETVIVIVMYLFVISLFGVEEKSRYLFPIFPVLILMSALPARRFRGARH
jgi:hypothetical protein